ncbi:hypothetical protein TcG_02304 [Trypanosoma cruzi]|nr:hypothetical protein TcG_02304 [Trypanosoma cruzi]
MTRGLRRAQNDLSPLFAQVDVHGSSKWTATLQHSRCNRPQPALKGAGADNQVGVAHTHHVVLVWDGKVMANPQIGSRHKDYTCHWLHGETLSVRLGCSGEDLPRKDIPPCLRPRSRSSGMFFDRHNGQCAVPRRVVWILRGNPDAEQLPLAVRILCGDGVRLRRDLSFARDLTHHRRRQRAAPHHPVRSTALLRGGVRGEAPTGAGASSPYWPPKNYEKE